MTLQQVADRLRKEFPNVATAISLGARHIPKGSSCICDVFVWRDDGGPGAGAYVPDLEAAFAWLHAQLDPSQAGSVEIEAEHPPVGDSVNAVLAVMEMQVPVLAKGT